MLMACEEQSKRNRANCKASASLSAPGARASPCLANLLGLGVPAASEARSQVVVRHQVRQGRGGHLLGAAAVVHIQVLAHNVLHLGKQTHTAPLPKGNVPLHYCPGVDDPLWRPF